MRMATYLGLAATRAPKDTALDSDRLGWMLVPLSPSTYLGSGRLAEAGGSDSKAAQLHSFTKPIRLDWLEERLRWYTGVSRRATSFPEAAAAHDPARHTSARFRDLLLGGADQVLAGFFQMPLDDADRPLDVAAAQRLV